MLGVGVRVLKYTGDYQLKGEIRAVFTTKAGRVRYVVEHEPGFLHIYSENNIKPIDEGAKTICSCRRCAKINGCMYCKHKLILMI